MKIATGEVVASTDCTTCPNLDWHMKHETNFHLFTAFQSSHPDHVETRKVVEAKVHFITIAGFLNAQHLLNIVGARSMWDQQINESHLESPVLSCFQRCNACCQYQTVNRLISQRVTEAANLAALEKKNNVPGCPPPKKNMHWCSLTRSLQCCFFDVRILCKNSILRTVDRWQQTFQVTLPGLDPTNPQLQSLPGLQP